MFDITTLIKRFKFTFLIRGVETDELPNAPTGWRDLLVEYSRSKTYMGLLRNITGQLDFSGYGAYLLRREYAKYRLMTRMNLRVQMDTRQPYNTYQEIYNGRLDFSKKIDRQASFTVGAATNDFSVNIDAYDTQDYAISVEDGINIELPGLALDEIATLIPGGPPDGNIHSDYFPPLQLVNNTQNSIDQSAYNVAYDQFAGPDFSTRNSFFYACRLTGKLLITGVITFRVDHSSFDTFQTLAIYNQLGEVVLMVFNQFVTAGSNNTYEFNTSLDVTKGDRLFLYVSSSAEHADTGITIKTGQIDLSYKTITPPTMCQAISGMQLFGRLLQAMNVNQDSGPNLPVPFQSFLLNGPLKSVYFSCSDSIRNANGSIFYEGDTLGPGIYKVIFSVAIYGSIAYATGQTFAFQDTITTFSGTGIVQKIQSVFIGNVYNIGDTLQAGGTYLVGGNTGHVTYNSHDYQIGEFFKFVLGADTFSGSDDSIYVKQIAVENQIVTNLSQMFQCIKSIQGGDAALGVENGIVFLETVAAVFRAGVGQADLGNVPKDWQSECASDMLYNKIKVGQKTQQYDAINANLEVSAEQSYTSPQLTPSDTLNLVSDVRFDPYGAEIVRITQNDSSASRSDNDTWGFWINTTPVTGTAPFTYYRPLGGEGLMSLVGVPAGYYNYNLSPKHNLLRGGRYLSSIFYNMKAYQLVLTGYSKNIGMVCVDLNGVRIAESDPVDLSNLGAPYFIPEYFTMTVPSGLVDANSYADIGFTVNGYKARGFIADYKCNFATDKPQPIKLLLTPQNDLAKFVHPVSVGAPVIPVVPPVTDNFIITNDGDLITTNDGDFIIQ